MMKFTNISDTVFNAVWAGETTVLNPGDAITVETNIARKFAKDISYATLLQARKAAEQEAIDKGMKIKTLAVGKTELEDEMRKYLTAVEKDSNVERAEKPKKKSTKKEANVAEDKPSDDDFE
jgi:hypothetical protein